MTFIEIGEAQYPLHFGAAALKQFCERFDVGPVGELLQRVLAVIPRKKDGSLLTDESEAESVDLSSINIPFSIEEVAVILTLAINSGYRKRKQEEKITEEDAYDLLDEKPGLTMEVAALFIKSVLSQVMADEKNAVEGAKTKQKRKARALTK